MNGTIDKERAFPFLTTETKVPIMKTVLERLKEGRLYFDGGTGTVLQSMGLAAGELPEAWNLTHPDRVTELHRRYFAAGADMIKTNTFGVNSLKYGNAEAYLRAAIRCANDARRDYPDRFVALDIGPTGKLLAPYGPLSFEDAVEVYAGTIRLAVEIGGVDLILIETMTDCYETKAAVLAAKENCSLPVFVTNAYDASGKLMTGATPAAMVAMLEGLGVDALGCNCSCGPDLMIPVVKELAAHASVPVIANPNAGLPETDADGNLFYTVTPEQFADEMREMVIAGATVIGGCCGTTPDYLEATVRATRDMVYRLPQAKRETVVSSGTHTVTFGNSPVLIGERINPTGKKRIRQALLDGDYDLILSEGVRQADAGAMMLDVNAGLPGIDEAEAVSTIVRRLQAVCDLPLQIDTTDAKAMERAMRICNGKPLVNSVNGSRESMEKIFPLVKKYGGCVIALTMDENGIPETAEGRFEIARRIAETAAEYGIPKHDIIADPLTLTVSSGDENAKITLDAVALIKEKLGICTSLGVSNVSFGLPDREAVNAAFFLMALSRGLDAAIMNPFSAEMMRAYHLYRMLAGKDSHCCGYLSFAAEHPASAAASTTTSPAGNPSASAVGTVGTLSGAIERGLSDTARSLTFALLENTEPLEIIEHEIVPALNRVGVAFEKKQAYLPQLLMAADAASAAFAVIKEKMPSAADPDKRIVIATVRGDLHDIGKNIVRVLLENFGFYVEDLGRDVPPETVAEAAKGCRLVGLSALMTTTVPAMEETIRLVHEVSPGTRVMVGGAVLTEEYAARIGADFYAADAMGAVRIAETVFGK